MIARESLQQDRGLVDEVGTELVLAKARERSLER